MSDEGVISGSALAPEVRGVVDEGIGKSSVGGLDKVTSGSCLSFGLSVDVLDTSELEQLFSDWGSDEAGSSGGRDQSDLD